jgi:hypothetical protein
MMPCAGSDNSRNGDANPTRASTPKAFTGCTVCALGVVVSLDGACYCALCCLMCCETAMGTAADETAI